MGGRWKQGQGEGGNLYFGKTISIKFLRINSCHLDFQTSPTALIPYCWWRQILVLKCSFAFGVYGWSPSVTREVIHSENFVEIIPVFSSFFNFFKKKNKKIIKAILCNFSMRLLKYF